MFSCETYIFHIKKETPGNPGVFYLENWWAFWDSNPEPTNYEFAALTN
jgi:hypothetical protein